MNKLFNTQKIFDFFLRRLNFLRKWKLLLPLITAISWVFAKFNLLINRPSKCQSPNELGETWQKLMPWDNQRDYKLIAHNNTMALVKICIKCPLKGSGKRDACDKFMHYDRTLMKQVEGQLTVLESQSNSGKEYCILSVRLQNTTH
jgi:hypothetical protein